MNPQTKRRQDVKLDRAAQAFSYLRFKWHTPFPVRLHFATFPDMDVIGATTRQKRSLYILMNIRYPSWVVLEYLLHEYAHAATWGTARVEASRCDLATHDELWGVMYARIYRDWHDDGGCEESLLYKPASYEVVTVSKDAGEDACEKTS